MKALKRLLLLPALLASLLLAPVAEQAQAQPVPVPLANFKNKVLGGDFGTNPWQRGTSNVGGNIANTATYTADGWFAFGGASSSINVSQSSSNVPTFATVGQSSKFSLQFQRTAANSNTAQVCVAHILESGDVLPMQGLPFTVSFAMAAGANFSGTSVNANIVTGTTADQGAATLISGWAGAITTTTAIPFTSANTAWAKYFPGVTGGPFNTLTITVPTNALELAIEFCWTPIGTAGTTDAIFLDLVQGEVGSSATTFERRTLQQETALAQRRAIVYTDSATALVYGTSCTATSTTAVLCGFWLPQVMRAAPTPTWSNTTSFGMTCGSTANAAASAWAVVASSATVQSFGATATTGTTTAGFGCIMTGKNTAATLTISADL